MGRRRQWLQSSEEGSTALSFPLRCWERGEGNGRRVMANLRKDGLDMTAAANDSTMCIEHPTLQHNVRKVCI